MKHKNYILTDKTEVKLWYLKKGGSDDVGLIWYLQYYRVQKLYKFQSNNFQSNNHEMEKSYKVNEKNFAIELAKSMEGYQFDHIISPPTSEPFAKVYRDAIINEKGIRSDLTTTLNKAGETKAAYPNVTVEMLARSFEKTNLSDYCKVQSLLIVDDILSSGKTITALLQFMRGNGLNEYTNIGFACPLWVCDENQK